MCVWNVKGQFFLNRVIWRLGLAIGLASLGLLSYSAIAYVTLQLPYMLHTCASFGNLPATSHSLDLVVSSCRMHTSELFFTLSHTLPLRDSHLNIGFLNVELQANLAQNKANRMVD